MKQSLFDDPKLHYPIYDLALPFEHYIQQSKQQIATTRLDLQHHAETIINANSPFEYKPENFNGKAILLIHGLFDSPFTLRDIGAKLAAQGYWVRSVLLPGHGTVPGALLNIRYDDWMQAVRYGIASFNKEYNKLFLIGYSTGATLALHHAIGHNTIAGAVLLAPAIKIRSPFAFASQWHKIISWWWKRAQWLHIDNENDYARYQSIAFNAVYQVYKLTHYISRMSQVHSAHCPLFFACPLSDATVSTKATMQYFQQYFHEKNRFLLYTSDKKYKNKENTTVRESIYPELNVADFSHIGFTISPHNAHYGIAGDFAEASRRSEKNAVIYGGFNKTENMLYDLLFKKNLIKIPRKRLTYNPDFDFMVEQIERFLHEL